MRHFTILCGEIEPLTPRPPLPRRGEGKTNNKREAIGDTPKLPSGERPCTPIAVGLGFFYGELEFGDVLRLVAAALVLEINFAGGAGGAVAVVVDPCEERAVGLTQGGEGAGMYDGGHLVYGG